MLTGSWSVYVSERLHIWADTANLRVVVNLVNGDLLLPERIPEGFDCNIKPDFVTRLENGQQRSSQQSRRESGCP
jgi:hypothetical protein